MKIKEFMMIVDMQQAYEKADVAKIWGSWVISTDPTGSIITAEKEIEHPDEREYIQHITYILNIWKNKGASNTVTLFTTEKGIITHIKLIENNNQEQNYELQEMFTDFAQLDPAVLIDFRLNRHSQPTILT